MDSNVWLCVVCSPHVDLFLTLELVINVALFAEITIKAIAQGKVRCRSTTLLLD